MELPQISEEKVTSCCKLLVVAMLGTGANKMEMNFTKFHDGEGKEYGDFKVIVKKIK